MKFMKILCHESLELYGTSLGGAQAPPRLVMPTVHSKSLGGVQELDQ